MLNIKVLKLKPFKNDLIDQHYLFKNQKGCCICCMMCVVQIFLCKQSTKPALDTIPQQSTQTCTPLVNKQFATGVHSDLVTGWRHIEIRTIYGNGVYY